MTEMTEDGNDGGWTIEMMEMMEKQLRRFNVVCSNACRIDFLLVVWLCADSL